MSRNIGFSVAGVLALVLGLYLFFSPGSSPSKEEHSRFFRAMADGAIIFEEEATPEVEIDPLNEEEGTPEVGVSEEEIEEIDELYRAYPCLGLFFTCSCLPEIEQIRCTELLET